MNFSDIFKIKPVGQLRYVTPCCSNKFNEHGTPIGYYVDALGREFSQESISGEQTGESFQEAHTEGWWDGIFNSTRSASGNDIIDVTFEEVKS